MLHVVAVAWDVSMRVLTQSNFFPAIRADNDAQPYFIVDVQQMLDLKLEAWRSANNVLLAKHARSAARENL